MSLTDPLEDLEFTPTDWDLATMVGLEPDETDRDALDELADAMLVWAEGREVEELTDRAAEKLWGGELRALVEEGLSDLAKRDDEWGPAASAALRELAECGSGAPVARAVVQRLATSLGDRDVPFLFCLCCIDEAIEHARVGARRELAVRCAVVARRNAGLAGAEVERALAAGGAGAVERLATDDRRRAVRARLGRIGRYGRDSTPALSVELCSIAAESLPRDAGADDVWCAVCTAVLAEVARPELN